MRKKMILFFIASIVISTEALASGTIYYGSRVGMEVSVMSVSGLDTSNAVIRTRHTRENAMKFCKDYANDRSESCIKRELSVPLNNEVRANCMTGDFVDFFGNRYRFEGKIRRQTELMAKYALRYMSGPNRRELADGSSASNYPTAMGIFQSLCPGKSPPEVDW